ncbi:hypothetical protein BESB_029200 [Besnoitia besnoiti]|uniref:3'-5' exonuclease domain-containing protein n=1 Tax=Besnoitia besnoiti TaxID=94643 RepID=A0A2A9M0I3_BESBE|nr:uncharacterized protein BESB_029200 [Besnoitia besnoiti]PFH31485.1 hypothetical protein BESB_029200 [Besnoitia besnoiti]
MRLVPRQLDSTVCLRCRLDSSASHRAVTGTHVGTDAAEHLSNLRSVLRQPASRELVPLHSLSGGSLQLLPPALPSSALRASFPAASQSRLRPVSPSLSFCSRTFFPRTFTSVSAGSAGKQRELLRESGRGRWYVGGGVQSGFSICPLELKNLQKAHFSGRVVLVRTLAEDALACKALLSTAVSPRSSASPSVSARLPRSSSPASSSPPPGRSSSEIVLGYDSEHDPLTLAARGGLPPGLSLFASLAPRPPLALIQLASPSVACIWQLGALGGLPRGLRSLLLRSDVRKVTQGAVGEVEALQREFGLAPKNFLCLHAAAVALGCATNSRSLQALTGVFLRKFLDKTHQLSTWSQDTLTPEQCAYAATDAYVSRQILFAMRERVTQRDVMNLVEAQATVQARAEPKPPSRPEPASQNSDAGLDGDLHHSAAASADARGMQHDSGGMSSVSQATAQAVEAGNRRSSSAKAEASAERAREAEEAPGDAALTPSHLRGFRHAENEDVFIATVSRQESKASPAARRASAHRATDASAPADADASSAKGDAAVEGGRPAAGAWIATEVRRQAWRELKDLCMERGWRLECERLESCRKGFKSVFSVNCSLDGVYSAKSLEGHANLRDAQNDAATQMLSLLAPLCKKPSLL